MRFITVKIEIFVIYSACARWAMKVLSCLVTGVHFWIQIEPKLLVLQCDNVAYCQCVPMSFFIIITLYFYMISTSKNSFYIKRTMILTESSIYQTVDFFVWIIFDKFKTKMSTAGQTFTKKRKNFKNHITRFTAKHLLRTLYWKINVWLIIN